MKRKAPTSIRFPEEIEKKIKAKADKEKVGFGTVVNIIITEYFKKKK